MERWKTSSKGDGDFRALLDGTFSVTHRALPRRSLNVGALIEEVTFEIVPVDEIELPNALAIALHCLRPATLILSLGPLLAAFAHLAWLRQPVEPAFASLALLGVLLFHASLNLLNDFADHMNGADRVNSLGGSRAIQRGWARAVSFKAWGLALLTAALVDGLGLSIARPLLLLPLGACSLGAGYYLTLGKAHRPRIAGAREAATFALGGPLLVSGFASAASIGGWSTGAAVAALPSTLALGCAFGCSALLHGTLGNLESLMRDSLNGAGTLVAKLGFDRTKTLVVSAAVLTTALALAYAAASGAFVWLLPMALATASASVLAARPAALATSPLSSSLRGARARALTVHWAVALGVVVGLACARLLT